MKNPGRLSFFLLSISLLCAVGSVSRAEDSSTVRAAIEQAGVKFREGRWGRRTVRRGRRARPCEGGRGVLYRRRDRVSARRGDGQGSAGHPADVAGDPGKGRGEPDPYREARGAERAA